MKNNKKNRSFKRLFKFTKKFRNIAFTSRISYKICLETGQIARETKLVYKTIKELQPCTSRMLANHLKIERSNITRCLYDLENDSKENLIIVAFRDKCKITNRLVNYYTLKDWRADNEQK